MTEKNIYTWKHLDTDVEILAKKIEASEFRPDMIVGIMRGGIVPAILLSHKINCPVMSLYWSKRDYQNREFGTYLDNIVKNAITGKKYLIVDDIVDSGETMAELKHYAGKLSSVKYYSNYIKFASLIFNKDQPVSIDYYASTISRNEDKRWIYFPWESNT